MNRIRTLRTAGSSDFPQWRLTMNAKQAWAVLTAVVLSYEIACREGQLLSEGVDEWLISRPILTRAAIAAMALHLGNATEAVRHRVARIPGAAAELTVSTSGVSQVGELRCSLL